MKKCFAAGGAALALSGVCACVLAGCMRSGEGIRVDGETRRFRIHIPESLGGTTPAPLVLALHQFSDTGGGMEQLTGFNELADTEGFIVVYPQGRWGVWRAFGADGDQSDARFLLALIDEAARRHPVDPDRIYATGASAGGMMVQYLACKTDRLAAIAPVMGSPDGDPAAHCDISAPLPVLVMHGTADPVIPFEGGDTFAGPGRRVRFPSAMETAAFWARHNGCPGEPVAENLHDNHPGDAFSTRLHRFPCAKGREVLLYEIRGGGHTWPGRKNRYPAFITGSAAPEPDATRVIWEFFKAHRRGG